MLVRSLTKNNILCNKCLSNYINYSLYESCNHNIGRKAWKLTFIFIWFDSLRPINTLSVTQGWSSWVEPVLSKDKCVMLKDHNTMTPVRLESAAPWSRVKHSTSEPLRSLEILHVYCDISRQLNLCILVSSANSLDSDQARQNVRPDLNPIWLTLYWYSWKNFLKKLILKKKSADKIAWKNTKNSKWVTVSMIRKYHNHKPQTTK